MSQVLNGRIVNIFKLLKTLSPLSFFKLLESSNQLAPLRFASMRPFSVISKLVLKRSVLYLMKVGGSVMQKFELEQP